MVGHLVRLSGVPGVGNGLFRVSAKSANVLTLIDVDATDVTGTVAITAAMALRVVGVVAQSAGAIDINVTGGVMSIVGPAGTFTNAMGDGALPVVGQWIKIAGAGTAGNNVYLQLTSVSATTLTGVAPTGAATEAVAGRLEIYFGGYVRNGKQGAKTKITSLVERRFEDHTPVSREVFLGMLVNVLALNLQPQAIANGSVTWFGNSALAATTVTQLYGSAPGDVGAPAGDVLNTSSNVGRIGVGRDPVSQAG